MLSSGLRILLTPALIGLASLVGRRWGPTVGGWLVGLPFTSGPVVFFLALDHGTTFAAAAAAGTLAGAISEASFCLAYGWLAFHFDWPLTILGAILTFGAATVLLHFQRIPLLPLFLVVVIILTVSLRLMRLILGRSKIAHQLEPQAVLPPPAWDLPMRMVIAAVFVVLLTSLAPLLGPQLAGLLAPFPVYASILAIFAQQQQGPVAAASVLRGLLLGQFAFASFFFVLASLLPVAGIPQAFAAALVVTLSVEAGSLWVIQRTR